MSEPLTVWPMRANTNAIALIPAAHDPDDVHGAEASRSRAGTVTSASGSRDTSVLLHDVGDAGRGITPAEAAQTSLISTRPDRRGTQLRHDGAEAPGVALGIGTTTAAPARSSASQHFRLMVARRAGQRYEDGGETDRGQFCDRART